MQVKVTFDVKLAPDGEGTVVEGVSIGRLTLTKQFHGDLEATSTGEMVGVRNATQPTSAGYIAVERVDGTLAGKRGTFVLTHKGTMTNGVGALDCSVVPASGTGELANLAGTLTIEIVEKVHSYVFEYELA